MSNKKSPVMEVLVWYFVISSFFLIGHGQRLVCTQEAMADIMFLVDGSASIGLSNFQQIREFLASVVSTFDIAPNKVRVGMVQFSDTPRTEFFLNTYEEKKEILDYIKTLPYKTGGTNTGLGLQFLLEQHFVDQAGSRVNQGVPQIAIVITDGNSQDEVEPYAEELKQKGIKIYAIGIKDADETQLKKIASQRDFVYSVSDFNALQGISHNVIRELCTTVEKGQKEQQECSKITSADIVLLVDSSDNSDAAKIAEIQQFLHEFLDQLDTQPNKVQVGLAQFSTRQYQDFLLGGYSNKVDLLSKLDGIASRRGSAEIGAALDFIRVNYFPRARKNVPQIAIVITNGKSGDDVIVPAQELRKLGIIVFVLNTGKGNLENLQAIANSPQEEFLVNMDTYQSTEELIKNLYKKVCIAVDDRLQALSQKFADIFILVDSTASRQEHQNIRTFLLRMVNQLNIGENANLIGLAQFSENVVEEYLFSAKKNKSEVMTSIRNLRLKPKGVRKTGNALKYARKNYFSTSSGSRIAQGFKQVLLVTSAGKSEDSVVPSSRTIKNEGVTIIAVGVGVAEADELQDIASPSQSYIVHSQNIVQVQQKVRSGIESQEPARIFEDCKSADIADIVFIVDNSGNIKRENFQLVRKFLQDTISGLDVGKDNVRIAIVQYSDVPRADVYLNTFADKSLILQYTKSLSYGRGKTNTGAALKFAKNSVFTKKRGSRSDSHVQQIAVVITDGMSADNVGEAAADLRRTGVTIFALGIKNAFDQELREIASYPPEKFVFNIESFVKLDALSGVLTKRLCGDITSAFFPMFKNITLHKGCKFTAEADIYFLLDESGSITYQDFDDMKAFILEFLRTFDIGPNKVRIGVVKFASHATFVFGLDTYHTKTEVEKAVKNLIMYGGGTRTDLGLEAMIPLFKEASITRKDKVRELLIVITDGKSEPVGTPVHVPANKLREQNVTIYAVGVKSADVAELKEISGSPKRTFYVQNYDALRQIKTKILEEICSFEACNSLWADVIFLIDGADTVDPTEFNKTKDLIRFAVEMLPIKEDGARVAVVQYSSGAQLEFALNSFYDKDSLQKKIMDIQQVGGKAYTGNALEEVLKFFEVPSGGRSNTLQVLVVVTDSISKDDVISPAKTVRERNIKIYAIGLEHASRSQLIQIAGAYEQVFLGTDFASLQTLGSDVVFKICNIECKRPELLDVIFLLDASGSTNKESFPMLKQFMEGMVKMADVGEKRVRFGVIVYSDRAQSEFTLKQYLSKSEVLKAISQIRAVGGRRNTVQALNYSLSYFGADHGGRRAKHISQVLCLFTDGPVADPAGLTEWPKNLAQSEVNMFAIGVDQASEAELTTITRNSHRAFHVNSYEAFRNLNKPITQQLCNLTKPVCEKELADLVFLIDGSESISKGNWTVTKSSIINIIENLDIAPDRWRVGVAQFSDIVLNHFHLNKYTNLADLKQEIKLISQRKQGTHTWSALKLINDYFTPENGSRINQGVSQNLLLMTDGEATDTEDMSALEQLRAKGIEIFVIGISEKINYNELIKIANSKSRVFFETFETLELKTTTEKVLQAICTNNIIPDPSGCIIDIGIGFDVSQQTTQHLWEQHMKSAVAKAIHKLSMIERPCCTPNGTFETRLGFRLVSGQNGKVIDDFNFEKYDRNVTEKVLELLPSTSLAFNTFLLDSFREKLSSSKAGVKVVVLFTDGFDDDMARLKKSSQSLQQSGVNALLIVALSGEVNYMELQFGRGYNYDNPLYINSPVLCSELKKDAEAVALNVCCNVSCSCVGPPGPPGIPGKPGRKGLPGQMGNPGYPGEPGAPGGRGAPGLNGTQGHRGCPGNRGFKGSIGYTGNRGEDGELGLDGVDGEQGQPGITGEGGLKGSPGRQGLKGDRGKTGPKGERGVRGDPGNAGADNNVPGAKGEMGYLGPPGDPGPNGIPGTVGERGEDGYPGRKGFQGLPGLPSTQKGQPGDEGPAGYPGGQGPAGRNGLKGNKGEQGLSGVQGDYGSAGDKGAKGNPGTRGPRGPPGDTGVKGATGLEGFRGPPGYHGDEGRGLPGPKGQKGSPGYPGHAGLLGEDGTKGSTGRKGSNGYQGQPGNRGRPGFSGDPGDPGLIGHKGAKGSPGQKSKTQCELVNYVRENCACCKDHVKCPGYPTELLLALDMSADVTEQMFNRMRSTAISLLKDIDIAETNCPAGTRVAVITYSSETKYLFRFSYFQKKKELIDAIEGIPLQRTRNQRNIGQAMRYSAQNVFKRVRAGELVKKVAIFFTHGPSRDTTSINTAMLELKAADINLGVIAFGDAPGVQNAIQADERRMFMMADSRQASRIKDCVICFDPCNPDQTCGIILNPQREKVDVDLNMLMDASWDLQASQYFGVKELLLSVLDIMDVSSQPTREDGNARIGVYQQSSVYPFTFLKEVFSLDTFKDRATIKRHIFEDMQQDGGSSRLVNALEHMVSYNVLRAAAPRKKRMVVNVLSDRSANSMSKSELNYISTLCQCNDVVMITLTVGEKFSLSLAEELTTSPIEQHLIQLGQMGLKELNYAQKFFRAFLRMLTRNLFPKPSSQNRECSSFVARQQTPGPPFQPAVTQLPVIPVTEVNNPEIFPAQPYTETYYDMYTEAYDYENVRRDQPQKQHKLKAKEQAHSEFTKENDNERSVELNERDKAWCLQDKDTGTPCSDFQSRWYYNRHTQKCTHFQYGGCGGNKNNFLTKAKCTETCGGLGVSFVNDKVKPDECLLARDMGRCYNFDLKWYYDASKRACAAFWYGGCEGNENRFNTEEECKARCVNATNEHFST